MPCISLVNTQRMRKVGLNNGKADSFQQENYHRQDHPQEIHQHHQEAKPLPHLWSVPKVGG